MTAYQGMPWMVPSGAMKVRRPRIPEDLAKRIDGIRGDVPFERWVRRQIEEAVARAERALRSKRDE